MIEPPLHDDEPLRLESLRSLNLLETPLEERFERITRMAASLTSAPIAAISLVDAGRQWFKSIQGLGLCETSRDVSFCGHAILGNEVMVVEDALLDERFADNPLVVGEPGIRFYAGCPVRGPDGMIMGAMCILDRVPRQPSADQLQILRDLAGLVEQELRASAANSVQHELINQIRQEQRRAMIDGLTRVWNRDGILGVLEERLATSNHGELVGLILADIDHFKNVNDTFGHPVGDDVLRQTALRCLGAIRSTDAVGRYGGEEFIVVLGPINDPTDAVAVADHLRRRVAETPMQCGGHYVGVTLSAGVAIETIDASSGCEGTRETLVSRADTALYTAKGEGRNCVRLAPSASGTVRCQRRARRHS